MGAASPALANEAPRERVVIERLDQLPRLSYPVQSPLTEWLEEGEEAVQIRTQVRMDVEARLREFEIRDPSTLRDEINLLRNIAILDGRHHDALAYLKQIRELHEKPADRFVSGLLLETALEMYLEGIAREPAEALDQYRERLRERLEAMPWEVVQDEIESLSGSLRIYSRNLALGAIQSQYQVVADRSGEVALPLVRALLNTAVSVREVLPRRDEAVAALLDYIEAHRVEKPDIWEARSFDLRDEEGLSPVVVAVWDSGVDPSVFLPKGKMWTNPAETVDGQDSDNNGFVDDYYGIAWDLDGFPAVESLLPLSEGEQEAYGENKRWMKGFSDLQAALDTEEAGALRERFSTLTPEQFKPFVEALSLTGNYAHGTHVAGIVAEGNPAVRLLNARITFDHRLIPEAPTLETTMRGAESIRRTVQYFRQQGVRVVNMSWGGNQQGIERALEANGVGDSAEMRAEMARILFRLGYDALVESMRAAPEILFVPAAGNSDSDVTFTEDIPSSIDLPNVLVVGAVDQAGEETGFTSHGKNVRAHASGFEVESYLPGGERMAFSGTSMAAPQVVNLAAKLLAIDPTLTPDDLVSLILLGSERSADGRRILIHPKRSLALLRVRLGEW